MDRITAEYVPSSSSPPPGLSYLVNVSVSPRSNFLNQLVRILRITPGNLRADGKILIARHSPARYVHRATLYSPYLHILMRKFVKNTELREKLITSRERSKRGDIENVVDLENGISYPGFIIPGSRS